MTGVVAGAWAGAIFCLIALRLPLGACLGAAGLTITAGVLARRWLGDR